MKRIVQYKGKTLGVSVTGFSTELPVALIELSGGTDSVLVNITGIEPSWIEKEAVIKKIQLVTGSLGSLRALSEKLATSLEPTGRERVIYGHRYIEAMLQHRDELLSVFVPGGEVSVTVPEVEGSVLKIPPMTPKSDWEVDGTSPYLVGQMLGRHFMFVKSNIGPRFIYGPRMAA